jgi:hypothetical protein
LEDACVAISFYYSHFGCAAHHLQEICGLRITLPSFQAYCLV